VLISGEERVVLAKMQEEKDYGHREDIAVESFAD